MVLEAVEDDLRGWAGGRPGYAADRVLRASHAIEHVMPRKWTSREYLERIAGDTGVEDDDGDEE